VGEFGYGLVFSDIDMQEQSLKFEGNRTTSFDRPLLVHLFTPLPSMHYLEPCSCLRHKSEELISAESEQSLTSKSLYLGPVEPFQTVPLRSSVLPHLPVAAFDCSQ
jgi:hypothetical protein